MPGESRATFSVFVNNQEFQTQEHQLSGAQIKALAGIPPDYELFEVKGDQTVPVGNEQIEHIHNKIHFRAIPAGTFGN
jgi:Multiubiquitin